MGRCAKRTKKIVKGIAKTLTPVGVALIGDVVDIVATTDWTNDQKRERAVELAKGALDSRHIEAKEVMIRAAVEGSVVALKEGREALKELGQPDEEDENEIATEE